MIQPVIVHALISGGKLIAATSNYLQSMNSSYKWEEINTKLDIIKDSHLKAALQFLKDLSLSKTDENANFCLQNAYVEFIKAKSIYHDKSTELVELIISCVLPELLKVENPNLLQKGWNKIIDTICRTKRKNSLLNSYQLETDNRLRTLDGLVFCYIAKKEFNLAKTCLSEIFFINMNIAIKLFNVFKLIGLTVQNSTILKSIYNFICLKTMRHVLRPYISECESVLSCISNLGLSSHDIPLIENYHTILSTFKFSK